MHYFYLVVLIGWLSNLIQVVMAIDTVFDGYLFVKVLGFLSIHLGAVMGIYGWFV